MDEQNQRNQIMKRLKATKRKETICLMGWEVEILVRWLEENRRGKHEQVDDHRKSNP